MDPGMHKESPGQIIERQGLEIGRLQAKNEVLREALRDISEARVTGLPFSSAKDNLNAALRRIEAVRNRARAALNTGERDDE